jgi:hypothetical protein
MDLTRQRPLARPLAAQVIANVGHLIDHQRV